MHGVILWDGMGRKVKVAGMFLFFFFLHLFMVTPTIEFFVFVFSSAAGMRRISARGNT